MCGECNCYDVDPSGDWGDIHGDTCECDERNCHATYDRYTDDFCSGNEPPIFLVLGGKWNDLHSAFPINLEFSINIFHMSLESIIVLVVFYYTWH